MNWLYRLCYALGLPKYWLAPNRCRLCNGSGLVEHPKRGYTVCAACEGRGRWK